MQEVRTLIILSILFSIFSFLTRNYGREKTGLQKAEATINRISDHDSRIIYYVSFQEGGKIVNGKSITYRASGKCYDEGDKVLIGYYYTKAGWPRVVIQDDCLISSRDTAKKLSRILLYVSLGFAIVAVLLLVKQDF